MEQPHGFINRRHPNMVYRLCRAMYGLKQSGNAWYNKFTGTVIEDNNIQQCTIDPCVYFDLKAKIIIALYVDDVLFLGKDRDAIKSLYERLSAQFDIRFLGEASTFLGMQIQRDEFGISFNQRN